MTKSYKIISLREYKEKISELDLIIAELAECEYLGEMNHSFRSKTEIFLFLDDSDMAQEILDNPEEMVELDLNQFVEHKLNGESLKSKIDAFAHEDYYQARTNTLILNHIYLLESQINGFLLYYHLDMFFYILYRFVIEQDYEKRGIKGKADPNEALNKFARLCCTIIGTLTHIRLTDHGFLEEDEAQIFQPFLDGFIQKANVYKTKVFDYLFFRKEVTEALLDLNSNRKDIENWFFKLCLVRGFETAYERYQKHINSTESFGHDIVCTENTTALILYPTPHFFIHKESILKEFGSDLKFVEAIDRYFLKHGINRISDEETKKRLETRFIFEVPNEQNLFYYKNRDQDTLEYSNFDEQSRTDPFKALIVQGQINLTMED